MVPFLIIWIGSFLTDQLFQLHNTQGDSKTKKPVVRLNHCSWSPSYDGAGGEQGPKPMAPSWWLFHSSPERAATLSLVYNLKELLVKAFFYIANCSEIFCFGREGQKWGNISPPTSTFSASGFAIVYSTADLCSYPQILLPLHHAAVVILPFCQLDQRYPAMGVGGGRRTTTRNQGQRREAKMIPSIPFIPSPCHVVG